MSLLGITSSAASQSEDIINIRGAAGNAGYYTGIKIWNNEGTTGVALRNVVGASGFNRFGLYVKDNAGNAETERLSILSTGNVGIGDTSPLSLFTVGSGDKFQVDALGNSTSTNATSTNFFATTASSTNLYSSLLTVGGTGLIVDSSRNVGIGISPTAKLDVYGVAVVPATSGTVSTAVSRIRTSTGNTLDIGGYVASPYGMWLQNTDWGDLSQTYPIVLQPNGGLVGIGIVSPTVALDVVGAGKFSSGITVAGNNIVSSLSGGGFYHSTANAGMYGVSGTLAITNWDDTTKGITIKTATE